MLRIPGAWIFGLARGRQRSEVSTCWATVVPTSCRQATMVSPLPRNMPPQTPHFPRGQQLRKACYSYRHRYHAGEDVQSLVIGQSLAFLRLRRVRLPRRAGVDNTADIKFGVVVRFLRPSYGHYWNSWRRYYHDGLVKLAGRR